MEEKKIEDVDDISAEELELIRTLSHMECIDDGVYPTLDFIMNVDEGKDI